MLDSRQCSPTSALMWRRSNALHAVLSRTVPRITIVFSFGILLGDFSVPFFWYACFQLGTVRVLIHVWQSLAASLETPRVVIPGARLWCLI